MVSLHEKATETGFQCWPRMQQQQEQLQCQQQSRCTHEQGTKMGWPEEGCLCLGVLYPGLLPPLGEGLSSHINPPRKILIYPHRGRHISYFITKLIKLITKISITLTTLWWSRVLGNELIRIHISEESLGESWGICRKSPVEFSPEHLCGQLVRPQEGLTQQQCRLFTHIWE